MKSPHILLASSNVRKLQSNLKTVVDFNAQSAIEVAVASNVRQLFSLGKLHFSFAIKQTNRNWRQKVSRLYYGAYNISRAVRLCVDGEYSTDLSDHKKIDSLPIDFPDHNTYANKLRTLREDRNLSDYDHTASIKDLISHPKNSTELVEKFMTDARNYLGGRGVII